MKKALILIMCICFTAAFSGCKNRAPNIRETTAEQGSAASAAATSSGSVTEQASEKPITTSVKENVQSSFSENTSVGKITLEEAETAVLAHAGILETEIVQIDTGFDYDDGIPVIEVEFYTSSYEYEYKINADDGHIIKFSREALLWETPREIISAEEAESIALEHAGLSRDDVTFIKTENDTDDERGKYEIEFICGGKKYEYDINTGGDIIKYEIDEIND